MTKLNKKKRPGARAFLAAALMLPFTIAYAASSSAKIPGGNGGVLSPPSI